MTYSTKQAAIVRTKIDLLVIEMDYCANTYGSSPCTASGPAATKCFNTFPTCQDGANFTKTTQSYKFLNAGLPLRVLNNYYGVRPYIKSYNELPTEIKEKDTVVKRLKIELFDEDDNDFGIDPYVSGRTSVQGSYWKKWLARNANYKGRIIKLYEGYEGLVEGDFELKFVGTIDNITLNNGIMSFEAVDLLKELSKTDYPLKTDAFLYEDLYKTWECKSETSMLTSDAIDGDYAIRQEFLALQNVVSNDNNGFPGALPEDEYYVMLVGYDIYDRPFVNCLAQQVLIGAGGDGYITITWDDYTGASYYKLFIKSLLTSWKYNSTINAGVGSAAIYTVPSTLEDPPADAIRLFLFSGDDPSDIGNWTELARNVTLHLKVDSSVDISLFDEPGYLKIDKEIIYYESITYESSYYSFDNCSRAQFNSKSDWHFANTTIYSLLFELPGNPFTKLIKILSFKDLDGYADTKFTTYESAWSDIDFSTMPIAKETKLNKIYFDLVNAVNCISWVGEDGLIKILKHDEVPGTIPELTDEANIIFGSLSIDENEESRKTQWWQYWERSDPEKSIDDKEAYIRVVEAIDATAESANEYNDEQPDVQYSTWLNINGNTEADVITYISALLVQRKDRTRDAQRILSFDVELKDGYLVTGDLIDVTTAKIQDAYGNSATHRYRIIKKTPKVNSFGVVNKFGLKVLRVL